MADTIRELIITDIKVKLETIRIGSGYNTDIGQNVGRGQTEFDLSALPAISLLPGIETASQVYGEQTCLMEVSVHALHSLGSTNASVLGEQMLGDMLACLIGERASITRINSIQYLDGGVEEYPTPEEQVVTARVRVEVEYTTNLGDPYNQP